MIEIKLTQGKIALIDDEDFDLVSGYKWCATLRFDGRNWYVQTKVKQRTLLLHRLLLGLTDRRIHVDHIDGDGLNNRRENLRVCTCSENLRNQRVHSNNTSGFKGVSWNKRNAKWRADIMLNRKSHHLGYHDTKEAAYEAYCKAAKELHGQFANFGATITDLESIT